MITSLATFGDSWPAGEELKDKTQAFGHMLAKQFNVTAYENCAIGGTSNDRLIFQLQEYIQNHDMVENHVAVFFITSASRRSLLDSTNNIKEIRVPQDWKTESDPVVSNWYRYFHSDPSDQFNLYKVLLSLQKICQHYKIQDYYVSGWTDMVFPMPGVDTDKIFSTTCVEMFGIKNSREFQDLDQNQHVYPNTSHPNAHGHAVIALNLYQWLATFLTQK
jgi:hypothetical protein